MSLDKNIALVSDQVVNQILPVSDNQCLRLVIPILHPQLLACLKELLKACFPTSILSCDSYLISKLSRNIHIVK